MTGRISDERFTELSADYEAEQRELKERAAAIQAELSKAQEATVNAEKFMNVVRRHTSFEELTPTLRYTAIGNAVSVPVVEWIAKRISKQLSSKTDVYVLDAKYYKYGATGKLSDLPESTSINKQITYGEFIAEQEKFKKNFGADFYVYNAFLMPYNSKSSLWENADNYICIGEAISDWKHNQKTYEHILGILIDVKHLMNLYCRSDTSEIEQLAQCIKHFCCHK